MNKIMELVNGININGGKVSETCQVYSHFVSIIVDSTSKILLFLELARFP